MSLSLAQDPRLRLLERIAEYGQEDGDESALVLAVKQAVNTWPGGLSAAERKRLLRAIGGMAGPTPDLYHKLETCLGRLPENQRGLRQAALVSEAVAPERAHSLWNEYLDDIDEVGFEPRDLPRVQALILERMGDLARGADSVARGTRSTDRRAFRRASGGGFRSCGRGGRVLQPA